MFRLRIQGGSRNGETLALTAGKTYVVGRARECDFRFPEDATISRAHAEIAPDGSGGWLLKNKSQHGSLVGASKVDADRKLAVGDVLTCGGSTFVFELDPTAGTMDAPTRPPGPPPVPAPFPAGPSAGEPKTPPPMPRPATPGAPGGPATPATPAAAAAVGPTATGPLPGKPGAPAAKGPALPAGAKGSNKGLIIGLVAVGFFLFCCCPGSYVAYGFLMRRRAIMERPEIPPENK